MRLHYSTKTGGVGILHYDIFKSLYHPLTTPDDHTHWPHLLITPTSPSVISTFFKMYSRWLVGVISAWGSGCGHRVWQWMVDIFDYLIMKYPYSSCLCTFLQLRTSCSIFVTFFISCSCYFGEIYRREYL